MKRDFSLVRHILLHIEKPDEVPIDEMKYDQQTVLDHMELLKKEGYIEADLLKGETGAVVVVHNGRLTWKGHDFIDDARNDSTWTTAMIKIGSRLGTVSLDLLKAELVDVAKTHLGLK